MKYIKSTYIFLIIIILTNKNLSSQELLFLPWGKNAKEIGLRKAPDAQFGPMSFAVKGNKTFILDTQNKKLKIFQNSKQINSIDLPSSYINDFVYFSENDYYLLEQNKVYRYEYQKLRKVYQTDSPQSLITNIRTLNNSVQIIINESSSAHLPVGKTIVYHETAGIEDAHSQQIRIKKQNRNTITVDISSACSFEITSTINDLGLASYLGSTPSGDMYIYLEEIIQHVPLRVKRQVYMYSQTGKIKKVIDIPLHMHTYVFSEFYVDQKGSLFHMISSYDGIYIHKLFSKTKSNSSRYQYPTKFFKIHHYNTIKSEFSELENVSENIPKTSKFDTISPNESLMTGDTYVQHQWIAESGNITNGLILDPNGAEIETPPWIEIGLNTKVPYKWGGFHTLDQFDNGLVGGKYAGDKATSNVSSYCVGVDCSGFVSRCWNLPSHYSTSMMDDYITVAYDNWDDLKPADAIHKVGHVRLFVSENPNGSLLTVEAAGADWRVSYRSFNYSQLSAYTPRFYINMQGTPTVIPRAQLSTVNFTDSVYLNWMLDDTNSIYAYHLYTNKNDNNWVLAPAGQLIAPDIQSFSIPIVQDTAIFYKVVCVSDSIEFQEGYPSDIYGYYNSNEDQKILIVDGFDRMSGSYNAMYHEFAGALGKSLAFYQVSFECADNDAIINNEVDLNIYEAVFWLLGDESTVDETFNDQEQQLLSNYTLQGGKIFISGSELAWDLDHSGTSTDKTFINDVLKTGYNQDDSESYLVNGVAGTRFHGLNIHFDDGTHGVYEEDYPDSYFANGGSYEVLNYGNGQIAALAYEGILTGGSAPAKILTMGFPFETIYAETERHDLMRRILEFFEFLPSSVDITQNSLPNTHSLFDNYPNPFIGNTNIRFQLANSQIVTLEIYKLNGQKVTTLVSQKLQKGTYNYKWDASEFAEGVYFYVFKTSDGFKKTKKMVLMP